MKDSTRAMLVKTLQMFNDVSTEIIREDDAMAQSGAIIQDRIRHFSETKDAIEVLKDARERLAELVDRLSHHVLPELFREQKTKSITVIGIGRATVSNRYAASIIDKVVGFQWLRDNGHEGLITETVNSSTLAAFAKNMAEEEQKDLPSEIFKVSINQNISITKR